MKFPRARRAGEKVSAPVALTDLFPTVADVVGQTPPPGLAGRSLTAIVAGAAGGAGGGKAGEARRIYSETLYPRLHLGWSDLADHAEGMVAIETRHVRRELAVAEFGLEDIVERAGGLARGMRFYRLPDRLAERRVSVHRNIALRKAGDTRLFVRVTQEDGHRAWSSPLYLFRA